MSPQLPPYLSFHQTHKKVGAMWNEAGLNWSEFLSKDVDVNKFVTEQVSGTGQKVAVGAP